jgi:hypothetical protein
MSKSVHETQSGMSRVRRDTAGRSHRHARSPRLVVRASLERPGTTATTPAAAA